jgi:hypothetical protein
LIFKLPLKRQATRDGCVNGKGLSYSLAMERFEVLMQRNKESTANAKDCISLSQRKKWYSLRSKLNDDLEAFLIELQTLWFGGFTGLLKSCKYDESKLDIFKTKLEKLVFKEIRKSTPNIKMLQFDAELCKIIIAGGPNLGYEEAEDILYYLFDVYQVNGVPIAFDEIYIEEVFE